MSVAEQLAQLRDKVVPSSQSYVPSLLLSSSEALREPRYKTAQKAKEALEALSAGDPALPHLAPTLLIADPRADRATLEKRTEKELSKTVIAVAHRLTPVFPIRHTQTIFEWLVRCLEVGRLGTDAEVDAILIASLPYHATNAFVSLIRAVLIPSPTRKHWEWLNPVIKQRKPIDTKFIAQIAPVEIFRRIARHLMVTAMAGVGAPALQALFLGTAARRLIYLRTNLFERRELILAILEALCFTPANFSDGKGGLPPSDAPTEQVERAVNQAKTALLLSIAPVLSGGLESELMYAALQAAVTVLVHTHADGSAMEAASSVIVLCLAKLGFEEFPLTLARKLAKWGRFAEALASLKDVSGILESYGAYLNTLAGMSSSDSRIHERLQSALSVECRELLCDESVQNVVRVLLKAFTLRADQDDKAMETISQSSNMEMLTTTLSTISRGPFATALDAALKYYFEDRENLEGNQRQYGIVDTALERALSGTSYVAVKVPDTGSDTGPVLNTLLGCLEHPEAAMRRAGLKKLLQGDAVLAKVKDSDLAGPVREVLMRRLHIESDLAVVASVLGSGIFAALCDPAKSVKVLCRRYLSVFERLPQSDKVKCGGHPESLAMFCTESFGFLCKAASLDPHLIPAVRAFFIGLDLDRAFHKRYVINALKRPESSALLLFVDLDSSEKKTKMRKSFLQTFITRSEDNFAQTLEALYDWKKEWGMRATIARFSNAISTQGNNDSAFDTAVIAADLAVMHLKTSEDLASNTIKTIIASLKSRSNLGNSDLEKLQRLWESISRCGKVPLIQDLLRVIIAIQGAESTFSFLKGDWRSSMANVNGTVTALQWRAAMLKSKLVTIGGETLLRDLVLAAYSSSGKLYETGLNICQQMNISDFGEDPTENNCVVFDAMKKALANNVSPDSAAFVAEDENNGEGLIAKLDRQLKRRWSVLEKVPPPLINFISHSEKAQACVMEFLLDDSQFAESIVENGAARLRALHGFRISAPSYVQYLLRSLNEAVQKYSQGHFSKEIAETTTRLMLLFCQATIPGELSEMMSTMACVFVKELRNYRATGHYPNRLSVEIAMCAGLCKTIGFLRNHGDASASPIITSAVRSLFRLSTVSSAVGKFTSSLIDRNEDNFIQPNDFDDVVLNLIQQLSYSSPKRLKTQNPKDLAIPPEFGNSALSVMDIDNSTLTGAFEALSRHCISKNTAPRFSLFSGSLVPLLWRFLRIFINDMGQDSRTSLDEHHYSLKLVLQVLITVYSNSKSTALFDPSLSSEEAATAVTMAFYPGSNRSEDLSVMERSVRSSGIALLEALASSNSKTLSQHILPLVRHMILKEATTDNMEWLSRTMPPLLRAGFQLETFLSLVISSSISARTEREEPIDIGRKARHSVPDFVRMCPEPEIATATALRLLIQANSTRKSNAFLLQMSTDVLLNSSNSVSQILFIIANTITDLVSPLAMNILGHPKFLRQLDATIQEYAKDESDKGTNFEGLNASSQKLFLALLSANLKEPRENALCSLLTIVPSNVITNCIETSFNLSDKTHVQRALESLIQRLEVNAPVPSSWKNGDSTLGKGKTSKTFVRKICEILRSFVKKRFWSTTDGQRTDMGGEGITSESSLCQTAIMAMNRIILRFGEMNHTESQLCGSLMQEVLMSGRKSENEYLTVASAAVCLSDIVVVLGKKGTIFVPPLSNACVEAIRSILFQKWSNNAPGDESFFLVPKSGEHASKLDPAMSASLDAAVQACAKVMEVAPKSFGCQPLCHIAAMVAMIPGGKTSQLLTLGVTKMPAAHAISALDAALRCLDYGSSHAPQGIELIMENMVKLVGSLRKKEVKEWKMDMMRLCVSGMEFRYKMFGARSIDDTDTGGPYGISTARACHNALTTCARVEEACTNALVEVILQLPESEFKELFDHLSKWAETKTLSESHQVTLEKHNVDIPSTVLTSSVLYTLCIKLFTVLRSIMCSYFASLLDRSLKLISTKRAEKPNLSKVAESMPSKKKKRNRESFESSSEIAQAAIAGAMEDMRRAAVNNALESIEAFLRHIPNASEATASTLGRIQESVLIALDESGSDSREVSRTLCALGVRMAVTNEFRTKEESRVLIMTLARHVLMRTREEEPTARRKALNVATGLATVIGDEFLVALPETMPVLADVVDDECDDVAVAAKEFVGTLERLSGENILEQLR